MKKITLKDVLLIALLSVVLGLIYLGAAYFAGIFVPFIGPVAYEIIYGVWFVAAPMAIYILRKPGTALITEILAALVEVLAGSMFGPSVLIIGTLQGLGSELGFTFFGYKNYKWPAFVLSAILTSLFSYAWSYYANSYGAFGFTYNLVMITVRTLSSIVFFLVTKGICDQLKNSGVLNSYAISQKG
ncbi:ECF transporter S component [Streptococcus sp. CSL10205-OR2]|uniref:ECF transporter S component n=1 Tax=Streptococcus sp. CSL10205-OR2 TaxID=2980558 RepID=UPI0021DA7AC1|nr:ECF transporter S component [Streptococcus sp. CSL10205-OR2]MCU9533075.1 ECF transporter S component [Streptococcus sp. CSL10205-OR2]